MTTFKLAQARQPSPDQTSRRQLLCLLANSLLLGACSANNLPSLSSLYKASRLAIAGADDVTFSREHINRIPYASCYAKIGDSPRAFLILSKIDGSNLHWVSAQREVLITRYGRIIQSHGLVSDLSRTQWSTGDSPLQSFIGDYLDGEVTGSEKRHRSLRSIDLHKLRLFDLVIESKLNVISKAETLEISELRFNTIHLSEENQAPSINWSFQNEFWIEANTGLVWKSRQHLTPDLPPVTLTLLKPAIQTNT